MANRLRSPKGAHAVNQEMYALQQKVRFFAYETMDASPTSAHFAERHLLGTLYLPDNLTENEIMKRAHLKFKKAANLCLSIKKLPKRITVTPCFDLSL